MKRLEIIKVDSGLYSCILLDLDGSVLWQSDEGISADKIAQKLHFEYGIHQLDIQDKLSKSDPDRFLNNIRKELFEKTQSSLNASRDRGINASVQESLKLWLNRVEEKIASNK
jgi:hypothetical protein